MDYCAREEDKPNR
jgi:hypothetical protein